MLRIATFWVLLLTATAGWPQTNDITELESASQLVFTGAGLPPVSANWQPTQLPFRGIDVEPDFWQQAVEEGAVWLRFLIERPTQSPNISLLLWRYNLSATVYFNRVEIAGNAYRDNRLTTAWNRPLLANIDDDQWLPGTNEVLILLQVTEWGGLLAPPLLGSKAELQQIQEQRLFQQVEINRILLAFAFSMGLFTLGLWVIRRSDTVYLWFSGICFAWATGAAHTVILYNPLSYDIWLPVVHSAMDLTIFFLYGFIGRLARARRPARERLFFAWTLAACIAHALMPAQLFWYSAYLAHLVGVTVLLILIGRVSVIAWRRREPEAVILSVAILGQIVLFLVNAFQMFFEGGSGWDGTLVYAHFGIPVLLLIFAAVLLHRFTQALTIAESLNRELEQKIEVSRQIIAKSFEERRLLEMKQATEQERQKIYRDLHDDVGSRLLSMIHASDDQKVGNMARSTLESLRQAVSRANTPDQLLEDMLHDINEESALRLQGAGHLVDWHQPNLMPALMLPSLVAFNINRIMKELVSNIIRHAQAHAVKIDIDISDDSLVISITDDGVGFGGNNMTSRSEGNGLSNLRARAVEIDAQIDWQSTPHGTRTRLVLHELSQLMDKSMPESPPL